MTEMAIARVTAKVKRWNRLRIMRGIVPYGRVKMPAAWKLTKEVNDDNRGNQNGNDQHSVSEQFPAVRCVDSAAAVAAVLEPPNRLKTSAAMCASKKEHRVKRPPHGKELNKCRSEKGA